MEVNTNKINKGSFIGFIPLLTFLVIYFVMGIGTGSFDNLPLLVGMFIATIVSFIISSPVAEKKSFEEKVKIFCEGGGDDTLILMVIIYMLAGAFYSVAGSMHATDTVTNLGISILPARLILPGLFIIACILSFSMGTSMGTVAALIPIAIDIAAKTAVSLPLVCGIVVGGAMFGDNLSFISDTTIAATATQNVAMRDKFKANIIMVLPAVIITILALAFWPIDATSIVAPGEINIINLLPYVLIIGLSLAGLHVIPAMGISILVGLGIGIVHNDFTVIESFKVIHEGMKWMQDMAIIAVFVGGVIGMMKYLGGIDWLLNNLAKNTKSRKGAEISIAVLVSLVDVFTTNNTMAIIAVGPIAKDVSEQYDIAPARTASILDLFSSAFNGLTPYAGQLLVAGAMAGISPVSIMPFVWYSILMVIFGLLFIIFGIGYKRAKKLADK
ncbi:Na+/H+ antiporter NhaC family protein [Helcococcus kunzii]|uniref:Na+/H+ antiporter NhaC family protein n=1 Tax=Helcococcus kunzii TaxID=40091 RepID=UPI0024ACE526|nr:Na+/H+ antiporter NhaC family protein [Helcococcus kunzii]